MPDFTLFDLLDLELGGLMQAAGIFIIVWGLVNAFFGYKLFKVVLAICGFLTGAVIGGVLSAFALGDGSGALILLAILAGGVIGAVLAVVLHSVGVFFSVGAMGFAVVYLITESFAIALVLGIVCGIIGVVLEKYAIIISTGLSGGFLAASGLALAASLGSGVTIVIGLTVGLCGILFQLWLERPKAAAAAAVRPPVAARPPQPIPAAAAIPPRAPAPSESGGSCCENCGNPLLPGESFCRRCGKLILKESGGEKIFCVQCGAMMSSTANFCRKCGSARGV